MKYFHQFNYQTLSRKMLENNIHFGQCLSTFIPEIVNLGLVFVNNEFLSNMTCIPLYDLLACPLNKSQISPIEFVMNKFEETVKRRKLLHVVTNCSVSSSYCASPWLVEPIT